MRIGIFVDGTFIPERDGASTRFAKMPRHLTERGTQVVVFHCYRGWSDLSRIAAEPFSTYFFPPHVFYDDFDCLVRLVRDAGVDIIQMDAPETILNLGFPLADVLDLKIVYEAHYHTSTVAAALDAPPSRIEALRSLERHVSKCVDQLIVFTEADRRRWMTLSGAAESRVSVIPFGVETVCSAQPTKSRDRMVFIGNLFYEPNRRAVERIAVEILPAVRSERPTATAVVVGDIPRDLRTLCLRAGIEVVGEVADPTPWLTQATLGLAPVSEGSGVRVKILQYLAAGLPVVATSVAAEGLTFPAVFLEDDSQAAALRCADMLTRPEHYEPFVRCTAALLRERFLWRDIAQTAGSVYSTVLSRSTQLRPRDERPASPGLPMWIQEVLKKGRFATADTGTLGNYRFGLAEHGQVRTSS